MVFSTVGPQGEYSPVISGFFVLNDYRNDVVSIGSAFPALESVIVLQGTAR